MVMQPSNRTNRLRELGRAAGSVPLDVEVGFDDEEPTHPALEACYRAPPELRSNGQQVADALSGLPTWAKALAIILPVVTTTIVAIIQALKG